MPETNASNYSVDFLNLLNNRPQDSKPRDRGFVVFVHGATDLSPLRGIAQQQTYNRCLAAHYGAQDGPALPALFARLRDDLLLPPPDHPAAQQSMGKKVAPRKRPADSLQAPVGVFEPALIAPEWNPLRGVLDLTRSIPPQDPKFLLSAFSELNRALEVGQRLLVFCELSAYPSTSTLEDLGLDRNLLELLLNAFPERCGLIFSGVPQGLRLPDEFGNRFLSIDLTDASSTAASQRSQPLKNDTPEGEDKLDIEAEIAAIADAIAFKDMKPPLVLGIIGGWGTGKSFVFNLLKKRLRQIGSADLTDPRVRESSPYIGHPYLISFDAWTYAKSELWASLMQQIFYELDRQLALEGSIETAAPGRLLKGIDLWEYLDQTHERVLRRLEGEHWRAILEQFEKWKRGDPGGSKLRTALEAVRKEEVEKLKIARADLEEQRRLQEADRRQKLDHLELSIRASTVQLEAERDENMRPGQAQLHKALQTLDREKLLVVQELEVQMTVRARAVAWGPMRGELESMFGKTNIARWLENQQSAQAGALESIWSLAGEAQTTVKLWQGMNTRSLVFLLLAAAAPLVIALLNSLQVPEEISVVTGAVQGAGMAIASAAAALKAFNDKVAAKQAEYEQQTAQAMLQLDAGRETLRQELWTARVSPVEQEIQKLQADLAALRTKSEQAVAAASAALREQALKQLDDSQKQFDIKIEKLETDVERYEELTGVLDPGKTLMAVIRDRIQSGFYDEKLGILHQVQRDINEVTLALLPYMDDPDVHPQEADQAPQVVRDLFPRGEPRIILFIDDLDRCPPSQVVNVLEAAQLLVKTRLFVVVLAMDVRYITRALEKHYANILVHNGDPSGLDYIEKIVQIPYRVRPIAREALDGYLKSQVQEKRSGEGDQEQPEDGELEKQLTVERQAKITAPGEATLAPSAFVPLEVQQFAPEEFRILETCAAQTEISPRSIKRLVNTYKLIKIIWYKRSITEPGDDVKQALLTLLSLSARFPEIMRRLLCELENRVQKEADLGFPQACNAIADLWRTREGVAEDWTRLLEITAAAPVPLSAVGLRNLQLVRAFSFVGELENSQ